MPNPYKTRRWYKGGFNQVGYFGCRGQMKLDILRLLGISIGPGKNEWWLKEKIEWKTQEEITVLLETKKDTWREGHFYIFLSEYSIAKYRTYLAQS